MFDFLVKLPDDVEYTAACACLGDGIKAYTALHYLAHVDSGESILVLDAAHGANYLTVQLALSWGNKV